MHIFWRPIEVRGDRRCNPLHLGGQYLRPGDPGFQDGDEHRVEGLCRLNVDPGGSRVALCGSWADPQSLVVRMATIGTAEEAKYTMTLHRDQIDVHGEDSVFGTYAFDLRGTRVR